MSLNWFSCGFNSVVFRIRWEEIKRRDTSGPRQFIKNLEEALDPATFNRVMFSVDFPENDNRSLIEVPEVRAYFRQLFFEVDSLFLWLDPDAPMFWCMGLLISNLDVMGKASPQFVVFDYQAAQNAILNYIDYGFIKLNTFCEKKGISPEAPSRKITDALKRKIKDGGVRKFMDRSIMSCIRCRIHHMRPNECFFSLCLISEVSDSNSLPIKYSTFTKCIDRLSDQGLISRLAPGLYYRIDQESPITVHDVLSFFTDEHRGVISGKWALYSKGLISRPGVPIRVFSTNLFRQKLHISGPFEESITVERINIENLDGEMVSALEALDLVQSISMLDSCYYSVCLEIIENYALHHFSKPALQALFQQRNQIPLRIRKKTFASLAAVLKRFDVECDLKLHIGTKYDTSEVLRLFYPELEMEIGEQQTPSENDLQLKEEQYVFSGFDL